VREALLHTNDCLLLLQKRPIRDKRDLELREALLHADDCLLLLSVWWLKTLVNLLSKDFSPPCCLLLLPVCWEFGRCACVCERECVCVRERERVSERERECVCVCVSERGWVSEWAWERVCVRACMRESVRLCACEWVCVCVFVDIYFSYFFFTVLAHLSVWHNVKINSWLKTLVMTKDFSQLDLA